MFRSCFSDLDECLSGARTCDVNASCTNSDGSYSCVCNQGFTGNGTVCDGMFIHASYSNEGPTYCVHYSFWSTKENCFCSFWLNLDPNSLCSLQMLTSARRIPICVMKTPFAQTAKGLTPALVGEDFLEMGRFVMVCYSFPISKQLSSSPCLRCCEFKQQAFGADGITYE